MSLYLDEAQGDLPSYRVDGVPGGGRTHDSLLRRQLLYPLSYGDQWAMGPWRALRL